MKTHPIVPAEVDFSDPSAPSAPAFRDVYHSRAGAIEQARHVFLGGNDLPRRWAQRQRFTILETGFGLGNNFLACWDAWRQDPQRCQQLVFISIEKHPLRKQDLQQAQQHSTLVDLADQLVAAWPPLTPNLHRLSFADDRVLLLLCLGDVHDWLRELAVEVDAFFLDGFNPASNPAMWDSHLLKAMGRHAAEGATAATWSVAPALRAGLAAAGFACERQRGFANKGGMCVARFAPRHKLHQPAGRLPLAPHARQALIIGAGLAGAACAWALAKQGIASQVIDSLPGIAQASSGNPCGLFHGTLNPDDGLHARFNRAAALQTSHWLNALPALPWRQAGLLRIELKLSLVQMQALIANQGLPCDYVQALDAAAASQASGLDLQQPAWFYPGGGALPPAAYASAMLEAAQAQTQLNCHVASIHRAGEDWQALDAQGQLLGEAPLLVLAGGHQAINLLHGLAPAMPLLRLRGQLSHLSKAEPWPRLPVAGIGYAIADGQQGLWCGATSQEEDMDASLREADHQHNLAQWAKLAQLAHLDAIPQAELAGRVGWRLATSDRLPLVGGLPIAGFSGRQDQTRFIPRQPGLAICMAMGSRGISWAALCAEVMAAQVTGAPVPLEACLLDAIDPARFAVRATRRPRS